MTKNALLTGASGFIGSHALEYFLEKTDWQITCPCSWRHKGTPERILYVLNKNPKWKYRVNVITHDLIAPFTDQTISKIGYIDYIINFASESHVDRSIEEPVDFIKNNVDISLNLLEFARKAKPDFFIQVSTDEVYGTAPQDIRFKEWSSILPSNPYAASKCAQEAIAICYWRTFGVPLILTNTVNNFGEMQDKEKFLARLINKISKGEKVTVHGNKDYIGGRFYLYVKNHADAILHIINNLPPLKFEEGRTFPDRYNITSNDEVDNLTMAKLVAEIMGKKLDCEVVDYHSKRPGHDRRYGLDGIKLKQAGWDMPFTFRESLESYIKWTLDHPEWI